MSVEIVVGFFVQVVVHLFVEVIAVVEVVAGSTVYVIVPVAIFSEVYTCTQSSSRKQAN